MSQAVQTKCEAQLGAVRFAPALRGTLARPSSLAAFYHTPSMCGFFFFFQCLPVYFQVSNVYSPQVLKNLNVRRARKKVTKH